MDSYRMTYNVDLVFCIDATGSMDNVLDMVKSNALHFYEDVSASMQAKQKVINRLRIRLVVYRDYLADGDDAMLTTDFFTLPDDRDPFQQCVNSIRAFGGGDEPEDGMEALAFAIRSPWDTEGVKRRQVIVVWTDASTHEIGFGRRAPNYPPEMAASFAELTDWWGDCQNGGYIDQSAKRLLLFAPDAEYWNSIMNNWDNTLHFPSIAGKGLQEFDYAQIIDAISNSI